MRKGRGEGDRGMHPALAAGRLLYAHGRMHRHHHDMQKPLACDPIDPIGLRRVHNPLRVAALVTRV